MKAYNPVPTSLISVSYPERQSGLGCPKHHHVTSGLVWYFLFNIFDKFINECCLRLFVFVCCYFWFVLAVCVVVFFVLFFWGVVVFSFLVVAF